MTGEAQTGPLRLQFDRSVKLAFQGPSLSSDGSLLLHRELDGALGLTDAAGLLIADPHHGSTENTLPSRDQGGGSVRHCLPFVGAILAFLLLLVFVPPLTTWLPAALMGR